MAIKIECAECGHANDLGRVFCTECGQKLDMARTSMPELHQRREFDLRKFIGQLVGWVIFLAVAGTVTLVLWPMPRPGAPPDEKAAAQVPVKAQALRKAATGRHAVPVVFTKTELSAFLALRAKARKLDALSIDLKPGTFELQAWGTWTPPFTNMPALSAIAIPISRGLTGTFVGGKLVVKQGAVGHLPLVGPLSGMTESFFASVLDELVAEKELVAAVSDVAIEVDKVTVKTGQ